MAYIGVDINYGNIAKQIATSSGSTTPTGALTYSVPSSESIMVMLDGVTQVPGTDFNVTGGTTLTFTTSVPSGVVVLVYFLGRSLDIGTPGDGTVSLAKMADDAVGVAELSATGTASSSTFLRGDNAWAAAGGTNVGPIINGLNCTRDTDTDHDVNVKAGYARDYGDAVTMALSSEITKRIDATWAVGDNNGGLDTGSVASSTAYGLYLIRRSDTGVVDVMFSLDMTSSKATATFPTNYDQHRLIGYVMTDTSSNIFNFTQSGDYFDVDQPAAINALNDSSITDDVFETATISVPPSCECYGYISLSNSSTTGTEGSVTICNEDMAAAANNLFEASAGITTAGAFDSVVGLVSFMVDSSSQIRYAASESDGTSAVRLRIQGVNMITRSNPL